MTEVSTQVLHSLHVNTQRQNAYLARQEIERVLAPLRSDPQRLEPFGFKVYSQGDEDGIIEEICRRLGIERGFFCEIGVENGLECNTLYLLHKGWQGFWIEGNAAQKKPITEKFASLLQSGRLSAAFSMVTAENINVLHAVLNLPEKGVDFYSIDIDGNDIHIFEAMQLRPKVLCIEYNAKFPPNISKRPCYKPDHVWGGGDYMGSSLLALAESAARKGYVLVATNITGANAFFVRQDLVGDNFVSFATPQETAVALYNDVRYWLIFDHFEHVGHKADFGRYEDLEDTQANLGYWLQLHPGYPLAPANAVLASVPGVTAFPFCVHEKQDIYISASIKNNGFWEHFESQLLARILGMLPEASFVLNIGANIGWYAILSGLLLRGREGGRVVAIEPAPDNFRLLQENVRVNRLEEIVHPVQAAASAQSGRAKLHLCGSNLGDHRLHYEDEDRASVEVDVVTIDELADAWPELPHVLIMDTQGHDAMVLKGAGDAWASGWRPVAIFEFWPWEILNGGTDPLHLLEQYWDMGYELFLINAEKTELQKVDSSINSTLETIRTQHSGLSQETESTHDIHIDICALPQSLVRLFQAGEL